MVACLALALLSVLGMTDPPSAAGAAEPALAAATDGHGPTERISGFLFLGFIRDIFRRPRAVRKKEDE